MLKKLLVISPQFNEEFILYQPWRQFYELGLKLSSMGIDYAIATDAASQQEIKGIKIIPLKQKNIHVLTESSKKQILEFNPDVILWMANSLSGMYIKKNNIANIPIVLYISTFHITWKELQNLTIKEILQSGFINVIASFFPFKNLVKNLNHKTISGIISSNNSIKKCLMDLGVFEDKILVAPLCFEASNPVKSDNKKNSNSPFTICYLGPAYSIRGVDMLLDTMHMLKKANHDVHLQFLLRTTNKEHEEKTLLEKCKKRQITDMVSIHAGILEKDFIAQIITSSDAVVIPTKFVWNEPPLAVLEAMSLGIPVITSNVCGLPELIGDNGFTINPNSGSLYTCIKSLLNDRTLLQQKGEQGKKFATSLSGWNEFAQWVVNSLDKLANKSIK